MNFNREDILIVGDSFAVCRHLPEDWPKYLVQKLTNTDGEVRGKGFSGASWWSTRNCLIKELNDKTPKILIITHTEMQRIPSNENYPLNSASTLQPDGFLRENEKRKKELPPLEVLEAGQMYYKYLFCKEFNMWAQHRWFDELDDLVEKYNIPYVIHLHAFMPWDNLPLHIFKHGITFDNALWPLSEDHKALQEKDWSIVGNFKVPSLKVWKNIETRNHFSKENNIKLAELLYNHISNYSPGITKLNF